MRQILCIIKYLSLACDLYRHRLCANSVSTFITIIHSIPRTIISFICSSAVKSHVPLWEQIDRLLWLPLTSREYIRTGKPRGRMRASSPPSTPYLARDVAQTMVKRSHKMTSWRPRSASFMACTTPFEITGGRHGTHSLSRSLWMHSHSLDQGQTLACRVKWEKRAHSTRALNRARYKCVQEKKPDGSMRRSSHTSQERRKGAKYISLVPCRHKLCVRTDGAQRGQFGSALCGRPCSEKLSVGVWRTCS